MSDEQTGRYTAEYLRESIEDFYQQHDRFANLLCKALSHLSKEDADTILDNVLLIPFYGDVVGTHVPKATVRGRAVCVMPAKNLADGDEAVINVLFFASHAVLDHVPDMQASVEQYLRQEDECWELVRKWLPESFSSKIAAIERLGRGSPGKSG